MAKKTKKEKKAVKETGIKKSAKKKSSKSQNKKAKKAIKESAVVNIAFVPNQKMFAMEITLLDKLQSELFEAIARKPAAMDYDEIRLFVDNVFMTLNKSFTIAKDVKNMLLKKDFSEPITETYNPPA